MKKLNKKLKNSIILSLLVVIASSVAIPVLADSNIISEGLSKVENALHLNQNSVEAKRKEEKPQSLTQDITTPPQKDNPVETIKAKAVENRKHRLHQKDEFNYNQKDVEKLILSGATLEDIYRSDEIGNQLLVNPKDLIETQKKGKKTWDEIEKNVKTEKEKQLKVLKLKHKDIESKFSKQTINTAEQLEILQYVDANPVEASDNVINAFRTEGRSGIKKIDAKRNLDKGDK